MTTPYPTVIIDGAEVSAICRDVNVCGDLTVQDIILDGAADGRIIQQVAGVPQWVVNPNYTAVQVLRDQVDARQALVDSLPDMSAQITTLQNQLTATQLLIDAKNAQIAEVSFLAWMGLCTPLTDVVMDVTTLNITTPVPADPYYASYTTLLGNGWTFIGLL